MEKSVGMVADNRQAQQAWARMPLSERLAVIRRLRIALANDPMALAKGSRNITETLSSEILPIADACRFLERRGPKLLRAQRYGRRGRPVWLMRTNLRVVREPLGFVLIIGASNYPLMLPGIQALQALVAGNSVLIKPGAGGGDAAARFANLLEEAGLPEGVLVVLDESEEAVRNAVRDGVDKVIFTGSSATGGKIHELLSATATPAIMEMSGCDAVFVLNDAKLDLVLGALQFGLTFNQSATCIAPRRIFVARELYQNLLDRVKELDLSAQNHPVTVVSRVRDLVRDATSRGAGVVSGGIDGDESIRPLVLTNVPSDADLMSTEIFAPILSITPFENETEAIRQANKCRFALGATVFGEEPSALAFAEQVRAGVVVINDMIVPTADPRLAFGGRGASGYGVTRGAEGLLALTQPKAITVRRGTWRPHFDPVSSDQAPVFANVIKMLHGGSLAAKARAAIQIIRSKPKKKAHS